MGFTIPGKNMQNLNLKKKTYKGEINPSNTLRNGLGSYIFPNAFFRYEGDYSNGVKHGKGKLIMNNGTVISVSLIGF